jgi:HAMP domain-containing protein
MSLSPEDLAAISQLLDQKLAAQETVARRRRRFWLWFWVLIGIISTVASAWAAKVMVERAQDELTRLNLEFSEAKLAYQRQLEQNRQLQDERAAAIKAVHYDSAATQAEHEAGLLSSVIGLIGGRAEFDKKWANADFSDPTQMEAFAKDLNGLVDQGLKPLGQIVLRNTDPAHNTANEQLRQDGAPASIPPTAVSANQTDGPTREPAAAPALAAPQ